MKGIGTFLVVGGVIAVGVATAVVAFRNKDAGGGSGGGSGGGAGGGSGGGPGGAGAGGGPEGAGGPKPPGRGRYAIRNPRPDGPDTDATWYEAVMGPSRKIQLPLGDLRDGSYRVRVGMWTHSGTPVCFDVSFLMDVEFGKPIVTRNKAGYIQIDDVKPCAAPLGGALPGASALDLGVQKTRKIGSGSYSAVNTKSGSQGPAYAVDVVKASDGIAIELRCAKDWQQRIVVSLDAQPL